jgi:hypothetical protein
MVKYFESKAFSESWKEFGRKFSKSWKKFGKEQK